MNDNSLSRLGGICCIVLGALYVLFFQVEPGMQAMVAASEYSEYWKDVAQNPPVHVLFSLVPALVGILGLVTVPAISQLVRTENEGWVRWVSSLALLGYAVQAIGSFRALALGPGMAEAYLAGDAATQKLIEATSLSLDPQGWLTLGGVGLWLLVINLLALRAGAWPKVLAYLGIACAILYWLVLAGALAGAVLGFTITTMVVLGVAGQGGAVVAPVWFIWTGLRLRKAEAS